MAQSSAPISQGTTAERQFTDAQWRDRFGDEPGVLSDMDGTSYALTVSGADTFSVGSATQASLATVAGFVHRIPAGSPEPATIPAAVGATRTDIIALRYDPTFTGAPGPVRLTVITGSSSAIPSYDSSPPGVEDLPLFAVTRVAGQTLAQATIVRMYPRLAPTIGVPTGAPLPTSSPLDTIAWQGNTQYRRLLSGSTPTWTSGSSTGGAWTNLTLASGWTVGVNGARYRVLDGVCYYQVHADRGTWAANTLVLTFPAGARPPYTHWPFGVWGGLFISGLVVSADGSVTVTVAEGSGGAGGLVFSGSHPVT